MLERVKIVLVNTTHPGNIGAAARAMKTMGLTRLALVAPRHFPSAECSARAAGADDVLAAAQVFERLEDAIAECELVLATSARSRSITWPEATPAAAAAQLLDHAAAGAATAVVFGRESTGLSNEQLDACHAMIRIPTSADYASLNLAAAAQIICYEIRKQYDDLAAGAAGGAAGGAASAAAGGAASAAADKAGRTAAAPPATAEEMDRLYQHLWQTLTDIGYFAPKRPHRPRLARRLKRLFNRARPDRDEVNLLRGILTAARRAAQKER